MKVEIDIHGLTEQMAYHGGNALKDMVRNPNKLRSKKIRKRKLSLNQGETILQLY